MKEAWLSVSDVRTGLPDPPCVVGFSPRISPLRRNISHRLRTDARLQPYCPTENVLSRSDCVHISLSVHVVCVCVRARVSLSHVPKHAAKNALYRSSRAAVLSPLHVNRP